jgi:hypothetical protein
VQASCDAVWDHVSDTTLPREQADVYEWCLHAALARRAVDIALEGSDTFDVALHSVRAVSPLTSAVGPLRPTGWGPTEDAVLTWHASCVCWNETRPFADRPPGTR